MTNTWALLPVKEPAKAKTRLAPVLGPAECPVLAWHMAEDVLAALAGSGCFAGIAILGSDPALNALGKPFGCRFIVEHPDRDWLANLEASARLLAGDGATTLAVVPGDLPTLTPADIRALLATHRGGVTVCPAARDGGTNALVLTPPTAIGFHFGPDSARRHLEAAQAKGIAATRLERDAFARDIDTPEDLEWLSQQAGATRSASFLGRAFIRERLRRPDPRAMA